MPEFYPEDNVRTLLESASRHLPCRKYAPAYSAVRPEQQPRPPVPIRAAQSNARLHDINTRIGAFVDALWFVPLVYVIVALLYV